VVCVIKFARRAQGHRHDAANFLVRGYRGDVLVAEGGLRQRLMVELAYISLSYFPTAVFSALFT
jgi:hypothetical protein